MIRIEKLNKSYQVGGRPLHVLRDLDLHVAPGELVAIMGTSGSGKSTLLNILGLLDTHDSGLYALDGEVVQGLDETVAAGWRNRKIGFIFQSFHLLPFKNAVENVALPLYYRSVPRAKRNAIALEYLERVGLAEWADHLPSELSGGQKQRLAIARALITEPAVILADEPTGALDSTTSEEVMGLIESVHASGVTVVIVTHDPEVAARTERTITLKDGRVVA